MPDRRACSSNWLPQGFFHAYRYVSLIPEPLSVVGGSRYWLSIAGPSPENFRIQWEWIGTGRSMDPTDRFSLDDGKTWQMAGFDVAFQISELPEPGGWLLLAAGVAAVAWWRQGRAST